METKGFGEDVTHKDSQLDHIEKEARDSIENWDRGETPAPLAIFADPEWFQPDGLYYEMRRKLYQLQLALKASVDNGEELMKALGEVRYENQKLKRELEVKRGTRPLA